MPSPELSVWEPISCGFKPRRWKPSFAVWRQRRDTMLFMVPLLVNAHMAGKYEQMVVSGSALC